MRDVRLLKIGHRELWLTPDRRYFGRQWREVPGGESWLDETVIQFNSYDNAIDWLNAPPAANRALKRKKSRLHLPVWRGTRATESR